MKLTTWSCARGFEKKKRSIFSTGPDIAVIQECSKKSTESVPFEGYAAQWVGENPNIGMGVFYKENWSIRRLEETTNGIKWVVPFEVTGPENFTLIAVWACEVKGSKRESYVGQINRALKEHRDWFESDQVVVAGDFNSNARWDKERRNWNHSTMVDELRKHNLVSVYHCIRKEEHGKEETPTFHLLKDAERGFHIDYIFVPDAWRSRMHMTVESYLEWRPYSDHCPITLDLFPRA